MKSINPFIRVSLGRPAELDWVEAATAAAIDILPGEAGVVERISPGIPYVEGEKLRKLSPDIFYGRTLEQADDLAEIYIEHLAERLGDEDAELGSQVRESLSLAVHGIKIDQSRGNKYMLRVILKNCSPDKGIDIVSRERAAVQQRILGQAEAKSPTSDSLLRLNLLAVISGELRQQGRAIEEDLTKKLKKDTDLARVGLQAVGVVNAAPKDS
jgi:hypothetical protein